MLSMLGSATAFQGATLRSGAATRSAVSMAVEDLVGGINDPIFGGTPEGKVFDPLGLGADEAALYRRRVVEIKHGRICMIAFLGMTVGPNDLIAPTHQLLAPSLDLHFDDIPGGIQAIGAVPGAGWAQIIAVVGIHELTINKQDYTKTPGEIPTFLGFKPEDPEIFAEKQLKELKNGRLAMIAVLGELMAQQVSGYGTYEQLGLIVKSLPLPL
jgi:light-harvesting complex I chlorophyll a/b binding protein 1